MAHRVLLVTLALVTLAALAPSAAADCPPNDYGEPTPSCGSPTPLGAWIDCEAELVGAWFNEAMRDCF